MNKHRLTFTISILSLLLTSCGTTIDSSISETQTSFPSSNTSEDTYSETTTSNESSSSVIKKYDFFLIVNDGGSVSGTQSGTYEEGTTISLKASANTDYEFIGFYEGTTLISNNNIYSFNLEKSITIEAKFESLYYEVSYSHAFDKTDFNVQQINNRPALVGGKTDIINGLYWDYGSTSYISGASDKGMQIGSSNAPQLDYWTLATSLPDGVILTSYYIEVCNASNASGAYQISIGEYNIEDTFSNYELTRIKADNLNILTNSFEFGVKTQSSKAIYFHSLGFKLKVPKDIDLDIYEDKKEANPIVPGENGIPNISYDINLFDDEKYYKNVNLTLNKEIIIEDLRATISEMTNVSYGDAKTMLQYTDESLENYGYVYGLFDGDSILAEWNGARWTREHVWPCTRMKFNGPNSDFRPGESTKDHSSDLHNLRAACQSSNTQHSNKFYDESNSTITFFPNIEKDSLSGHHSYSGDFRGDVARTIFYMYIRYEGLELTDNLDNSSIMSMGKLSTLLTWNELDPVDAFEIQRNNRIYEYQGNRNPFIDHPEYTNYIF